MQYCSHVGFLYNIVPRDSAQPKIYKFDFRIRGLVVKSASPTSSPIRAIRFFQQSYNTVNNNNIYIYIFFIFFFGGGGYLH